IAVAIDMPRRADARQPYYVRLVDHTVAEIDRATGAVGDAVNEVTEIFALHADAGDGIVVIANLDAIAMDIAYLGGVMHNRGTVEGGMGKGHVKTIGSGKIPGSIGLKL